LEIKKKMGKNNLLKDAYIYVCGPIDCADDAGVGWRQQITKELKKMGVVVLDPTNKPTYDFAEGPQDQARRLQLKRDGRFEELREEGRGIRAFDLRCVDKADAVVVYLDSSITMCGTIEELTIANLQQKPCLIFCRQGKVAIPNWIYWMINPKYIFNDMNEVVEYLRVVDAGGDSENPRWKLFDFSAVVE
jgi:nucleoside 2-deoxyribosyltransferase